MLVSNVFPELNNAAQPTNKLAIPPEPLKIATISGMLVICTLCAATAPIIDPATAAIIIQSNDKIFLLKSVTATAISIAAAEYMLPLTALSGDPSFFKPKIKSAAAITYQKFITTRLMICLLVVIYLFS